MPRPPIPDDVAGSDPTLARVAALRDRLAELRQRIGVLLDELEASPRTPDGTHLIVDARVAALLAQIEAASRDAEAAEAAARALMFGL